MYSVLRIAGIPKQLDSLLEKLEEQCSDLNPEINKTKMLVVDLSQNQNTDHWAEVANALDRISALISESGVGDIGLSVNTAFERKQIPNGGIAIDSLFVSQIALDAMAKIGADYEATIYPIDEK